MNVWTSPVSPGHLLNWQSSLQWGTLGKGASVPGLQSLDALDRPVKLPNMLPWELKPEKVRKRGKPPKVVLSSYKYGRYPDVMLCAMFSQALRSINSRSSPSNTPSSWDALKVHPNRSTPEALQVAGTIAETDEGWPKGFRRSRAWSQYDSAGMRNEGVRKKIAVNCCKSLGDFECPFDKISKLLAPIAGIQIALIARVSKISIKQLAWVVSYQFCFTIGSLAPWPPTPAWVLKVDTTVVDSKVPSMEGSCAKLSSDDSTWKIWENLGKSTSCGQCSSIFWGRTCFSMSCWACWLNLKCFLEGTTRNQQRSSRKRIQLWKRDIYPLMTLIYRWFSH